MSAYATLSSGPMTYRGLHWDDGRHLGIKTGPVGAELFEQFAQAFGGPSDAKRINPRRGNASPGRRFPDGRTKLPAALAIAVTQQWDILIARRMRPPVRQWMPPRRP